MDNKVMSCIRCRIPRAYYDLKIEPSIANPDFHMPVNCQCGHLWGYDYISASVEPKEK